MKNFYLLLILISFTSLLIPHNTQAQFPEPPPSRSGEDLCGGVFDETPPSFGPGTCDFTSSTFIEDYRNPGYWIPDATMPIKTVLVNIVVCRDDNGENGWQDVPEFHDNLAYMFQRIN